MANKDYINEEASTTWNDTTGDKVIPMTGLAVDAVAVGAFLDLGAAPRADEFTVELKVDGFATAGVVGEDVPFYFIQSEDGTIFDGVPNTAPLATTAGAMGSARLPNATPVDFAVQTSNTSTTILKITSAVRLTSRYIAPCVHNNTADVFATTATGHTLTLTPKPRELQ
jgi:hypothetical protein